MSNPIPKASRRVRFEEVTPAHEYAAFFNVSISPLVAHLGLPIFDGYDDLDDLQLAFLTLPSGETVTLVEYAGVPGTSLCIEVVMQDIHQIIFDSCQQLRVSRQEIEWIHPDWQVEFDRLATKHGEIESIAIPRLESLPPNKEREPIDCFYYALNIYTRPKFPEHWAMLQHNLGLAYFDRLKGERWENLQKSIECFNKSLEIFTQDKSPLKWQINQEDLSQSKEALKIEKQNLIIDILDRPIPGRKLRGVDLRGAKLNGADLRGANLLGANLRFANLDGTNFGDAISTNKEDSIKNMFDGIYTRGEFTNRIGVTRRRLPRGRVDRTRRANEHTNLSDANLSDSSLIGANLIGANLTGVNLRDANVKGARFGNNPGISRSMKQDLIDRGAIFDDVPPGDRSESRILAPH